MRNLLLKGMFQSSVTAEAPTPSAAALEELAAKVDRSARGALGRSLALWHVDAGSCNGCELELRALTGAVYDLERFGMRFVASPRHADVLLVTGPVTANMRAALEGAHAAMPRPKWVVAVGDCAFDGGIFQDSYAVVGGASRVVPVHLHIRGCPPSPTELLEGLLGLLVQYDRVAKTSTGPAAPAEAATAAALPAPPPEPEAASVELPPDVPQAGSSTDSEAASAVATSAAPAAETEAAPAAPASAAPATESSGASESPADGEKEDPVAAKPEGR